MNPTSSTLSATYQPPSSSILPQDNKKWHFIVFWNFITEIFLKDTQDKRYSPSFSLRLKIFPIFQLSNWEKNAKETSTANQLAPKLSLEKATAIFGSLSPPSWTEEEESHCLAIFLSSKNSSGSSIKDRDWKAMKKSLDLENSTEFLRSSSKKQILETKIKICPNHFPFNLYLLWFKKKKKYLHSLPHRDLLKNHHKDLHKEQWLDPRWFLSRNHKANQNQNLSRKLNQNLKKNRTVNEF